MSNTLLSAHRLNFEKTTLPGIDFPVIVHDGVIPRSEPEGLCIDGRDIPFVNPYIPSNIYNSLVGGSALERRGGHFDGVTFFALMMGCKIFGTEFKHNYNTLPRLDQPSRYIGNNALILAAGFHDGVEIPRHNVVPAHILVNGESESGLQKALPPADQSALVTDSPERVLPIWASKLGYEGPVVLTTLSDVMKIYGCTIATPIENVAIENLGVDESIEAAGRPETASMLSRLLSRLPGLKQLTSRTN